jgi:hypothetical protein
MTVLRSRVRTSPILSAVVACLFAGYVVALTPHLVHHLFDGGDDQPQCPHLAQSQHTPEAWSDPPTALSLPAIGRLAVCPDRTSLPFTKRTVGSSRAPPARTSLA